MTKLNRVFINFLVYLSAIYDFFTFEDIKNDIEKLFHK